LNKLTDAENTKRSKKAGSFNRNALLKEPLTIKNSDGRAAYARPLLVHAYAEVMTGKHPKEEGGCLFITEEMRQAQLQKQIDHQTNNHLIRHRLLILERLLRDLIAEPAYANGDKSRIAKITIEVNRDLREMSGKSAKEIQQDLGRRLANHHGVAAKLETDLDGRTFNGKPIQITAGLIRKARIAEDLGWACPYTGKTFDAIDLVSRQVDKDHIIPRSLRPSDSLDSLVVTFAEVNKMKGQRTAWQFVSDEQGKVVDGSPQLSIVSMRRFEELVKALDVRRGHEDDQRRKKKRKELMLLATYEEKGFVPRDLTVTSQLVRLGAQIIKKTFAGIEGAPLVVSLPGAVTGTVRKGWNLLGCLELAAPQVKEADGSIKNKTDIRDLTHLHHALDACVLGLASHYLPNNGGLWEVMIKRNPNDTEKALLCSTGYFDFDSQGRFGLTELPDALKEQIRQRLAEKRVVQHIPADMSGMRVEENTRGITAIKDGRVFLRQQSRDAKTGKLSIKPTEESANKVIGLKTGKLTPQKGVRVITDNFGVAILDHAAEGEEKFIIVPWHKVWPRIQELKPKNSGKPPRLLRIGTLVRIPKKAGRSDYRGLWMVRGVQFNQKAGFLVDLSSPDVIQYRVSGRDDCAQNIRLQSLYDGGLEILKTPLTGVISSPSKPAE
jgi:CRISPR-associated endonuclease Csn1